MQNYPESVTIEDIACPLGCPRDDVIVLVGHDRLHKLPGDFTIVSCKHCGLMRTNPRPTPATIGMYYPSDYAPYHNQNQTPKTALPTSKLKQVFRKITEPKTRLLPAIPPGRMLEIGCSSGGYLEVARYQGWEAEGIEFSEEAASVARNKGFRVQSGTLATAQAPLKPYDIITAWMVLEHLHYPVDDLRTLRGWIKNDGYLVALVPDAKSLAKLLFGERCYDLQLPTHLFHYTPQTISKVLAKAGWALERVYWQRNCNTLLWSMQYWAEEKGHKRINAFAIWLRTSFQARYLRLALSWLLGLTRQSGRVELWARPIKENIQC